MQSWLPTVAQSVLIASALADTGAGSLGKLSAESPDFSGFDRSAAVALSSASTRGARTVRSCHALQHALQHNVLPAAPFTEAPPQPFLWIFSQSKVVEKQLDEKGGRMIRPPSFCLDWQAGRQPQTLRKRLEHDMDISDRGREAAAYLRAKRKVVTATDSKKCKGITDEIARSALQQVANFRVVARRLLSLFGPDYVSEWHEHSTRVSEMKTVVQVELQSALGFACFGSDVPVENAMTELIVPSENEWNLEQLFEHKTSNEYDVDGPRGLGRGDDNDVSAEASPPKSSAPSRPIATFAPNHSSLTLTRPIYACFPRPLAFSDSPGVSSLCGITCWRQTQAFSKRSTKRTNT